MTIGGPGHFPRGGDAFSVRRCLGTCCQRRVEFDFGPRHCPGDWVVSSCSTDSMFGKVALCIQEPQALTLIGAMEEIPPSQWEVEPFSHLDIKVIRREMRMTQRLPMDPNHVDDIHGKVFLVLGPFCTPFETTVTLTHNPGKGWQVVHTGSFDASPPGHEFSHWVRSVRDWAARPRWIPAPAGLTRGRSSRVQGGACRRQVRLR